MDHLYLTSLVPKSEGINVKDGLLFKTITYDGMNNRPRTSTDQRLNQGIDHGNLGR